MRVAVFLLVLIAISAMATVRTGTSYRSDAELFDSYVRTAGVYTEVSIERYAGGYQYIGWFDNDYYDLIDDAEKCMAIVLAAGIVSEGTNWTSVGAIMVFEDQVVAMPTANCRELVSMVSSGMYSTDFLGMYYLSNTYALPRSSTVYPRP